MPNVTWILQYGCQRTYKSKLNWWRKGWSSDGVFRHVETETTLLWALNPEIGEQPTSMSSCLLQVAVSLSLLYTLQPDTSFILHTSLLRICFTNIFESFYEYYCLKETRVSGCVAPETTASDPSHRCFTRYTIYSSSWRPQVAISPVAQALRFRYQCTIYSVLYVSQAIKPNSESWQDLKRICWTSHRTYRTNRSWSQQWDL